MTGLLPPAQHGVVLTGVKAMPKGRAFGPAWTPAAGDIHQQRAGASRRTKIRQFQVSTVRGDGRPAVDGRGTAVEVWLVEVGLDELTRLVLGARAASRGARLALP